MFSLNEKVVYPGHGVAKINRIIERRVGGQQTTFFELKFLDNDMTVLVPIDNLSSIGVRKVSSDEKIKELFDKLSKPATSDQAKGETYCGSNWGKRLKRYHFQLIHSIWHTWKIRP